MFGERLVIANAVGCSSVWGGWEPSNPYTVSIPLGVVCLGLVSAQQLGILRAASRLRLPRVLS
jgi:pyruvate/2-oxoacid:ferredoxin oxidoreductase beta subunit